MNPLEITPEHARSLEQQARRIALPCGSGSMVWRGWGSGKDAVVLLHGGAGSWVHWVRNIEALTPHFSVWVPDLPGMGESALPPDPWTPASIADITEAAVQQLLGDARVDLVGFSFGGMIGGHLAAQYPERVQRLVIMAAAGTGISTDPVHRMRSWRGITDPAARRDIHRYNLSQWMLDSAESADALAVAMLPPAIEADRLRNREVSRTDVLLKVLPHVGCPVHGIWGAEDIMFRDAKPELASALKAAGVASLRFIPGAGHWVQYERAAEFNAALLETVRPGD